MKKIIAVVVTYNRCTLLKECIENLIKIRENIDIYIIDNASTDGTKECINEFSANSNLKYFNTGKNIGGAGGFNYGIRKAFEDGADYVWIMDDDTMVHQDSLTQLLKTAEEVSDNFGWLSSLAIWTDGMPCIMNSHVVDTEWNLEKHHIMDGRLLCQTATFVSLFLKREAVYSVGLPISDYFIWGDDTEYTMRMARKYPCYFVPNSQVTHKMRINQGTSVIEKMTDINRIDRMYFSIRNDFCTMKRIGSKKIIRFIIGQIQSLFRVIKSDYPFKGRKIKVILKGMWDGLWFHPRIEMLS